MNKADGKIAMAKLARIKRQQAESFAEDSARKRHQAELFAEEAQLFSALAEGETVDLRTGRLRPTLRRSSGPRIADSTPTEIAAARQAVRQIEISKRTSSK